MYNLKHKAMATSREAFKEGIRRHEGVPSGRTVGSAGIACRDPFSLGREARTHGCRGAISNRRGAALSERLHNLSVYDAAYLELAIRRKLPLGCKDGTLIEAARNCGAKLL